MNKPQREHQLSLFGEILDWMLTPLLLLWPLGLALTWLVAQEIAHKPFDRALEYNAHVLAQWIAAENETQTSLHLPHSVRQILRVDDVDLVYYQIIQANGKFLLGEHDLPLPVNSNQQNKPNKNNKHHKSSLGIVQLRDDEFDGYEIRVASLWVRVDLEGNHQLNFHSLSHTKQEVYLSDLKNNIENAEHFDLDSLVLIQVAETKKKRSALAGEIIKGVMLPQFVMLPLAALLVWLALSRGLKPLSLLEQRIRQRQPDDLSPLDGKSVPMEVAPLVASVNDLLNRLKDSILTQKRFLADAAHQLKTPLAGLRMQADLAQREGSNTQELKLSLKQIERASMRATHTVNQLLALARAENGASVLIQQPCDLVQLTLDVIHDSVPRALEKHIDLGYDGATVGALGVQLMGNPTLLRELIRNLIDNAINYTPSTADQQGVVTVHVSPNLDSSPPSVLLQVEDSGIGIAPSERELVFQPFYRALGNDADGSGLGLAIASEIARQHHAKIDVEDAQPLRQPRGSCFKVTFTSLLK